MPNNANAWYFLQNNVYPYANSIVETVGGTEVLRYQPVSMIIGTTLPDRTGTAQNGTITFGANPVGVTPTLSSLVSVAQPVPGTVSDRPTRDLLPSGVGGTNPVSAPDVSGTLLTNPLRPFVRILVDTTSVTERQAWVYFGLIFVLMVLAATAKAVKGHYVIVGVATGAAIGTCVVMTIFPLYALIFVVMAILAGVVAERSPSL